MILWSSPTIFGTLCILTCVFSAPAVAKEAATATLTFVGKRLIAFLAFPSNTSFSSVSIINWSLNKGVPFNDSGPFLVSIPDFTFPINDTVLRTSNPPIAPDAICIFVLFCIAVSFTLL